MNAVNKLLRDFFSLYGLFYPSRLHHVLKGFSVFRKLNYGETLKFCGKPVIELRSIMNWSFVSHKRFSCSCFQYPRRGSPIGFFNPVIPPKVSSNLVIPRAIFGIPPPAHTFNTESLPDFTVKSRIPSFKLGKSRIPENLLGTLLEVTSDLDLT